MFSLWCHWNTLCRQANDHTDIFINQPIECYLNNTINFRPFTPRIMPCYTHKMAIVSWPQILWRHFTLPIRYDGIHLRGAFFVSNYRRVPVSELCAALPRIVTMVLVSLCNYRHALSDALLRSGDSLTKLLWNLQCRKCSTKVLLELTDNIASFRRNQALYHAPIRRPWSLLLLYIGWSDVIESMVTMRSPFRGYNTI